MADKIGTWIYYNRDGNQLSKVQHNQVVRQNNDFTLLVAFDSNLLGLQKEIIPGFKAIETDVYAKIRRSGEDNYIESYVSHSQQGVIEKFKKISPNEMTYGLVDGKDYIVYELKFENLDEGIQITSKYGNMNVKIELYNETNSKKYELGVIDLYVQPTYDEVKEDASDLAIVENKLKQKVDSLNGSATNLTVKGKLDAREAILTDPILAENPIPKKYADQNFVSRIDTTNKEADLSKTHIKITKNGETTDVEIPLPEQKIKEQIEKQISEAEHITDISAFKNNETTTNYTGIKYKTDKNDTIKKVTIPLPAGLITEDELKLEYNVKSIENGKTTDLSEAGWAKFHYKDSQNIDNTIKTKMPGNMIYYSHSDDGEDIPADIEYVARAEQDAIGNEIAGTYVKDIEASLDEDDVLSINYINGKNEAILEQSKKIDFSKFAHDEDLEKIKNDYLLKNIIFLESTGDNPIILMDLSDGIYYIGEDKLCYVYKEDITDVTKQVSGPLFLLVNTQNNNVCHLVGNISIENNNITLNTHNIINEVICSKTTRNIRYFRENATKSDLPTKLSELENDEGYINSLEGYATETFVNNKISELIGSSPDLLNTFEEFSKALGNDPNFATTIMDELSKKAGKAATLSGYGITDAKIENGVIFLGNDSITPLTYFNEEDPTVPSWAKQPNKPTYTYDEIQGTPSIDYPVKSVNGKTGDVNIDIPVSSVNGATGDVQLDIPQEYLKNITEFTPSSDVGVNEIAYGYEIVKSNGTSKRFVMRVYENATETLDGLMSSEDKKSLDNKLDKSAFIINGTTLTINLD